MGYSAPAKGSRRVVHAMTLLEAYQESIKSERDGHEITEWTFQTETGRRMLGLDPGDYYRKAPLPVPPGLVPCPRGSCQICRWSGITTRRNLAGYRPWQLEPLEAA